MGTALGSHRRDHRRTHAARLSHSGRRGRQGLPRPILVRDRVLPVELKSDTGKLTAERDDWLVAFELAGVVAYVRLPDDWDEIETALMGR